MKAALLSPPRSIDELMARAWLLEQEATQRYTEFAEVMETHNNREVADLFRSLAAQEAAHADHIHKRMGWARPPDAAATVAAPEAPPLEEAHYLMQPWHALTIALQAEQQAHDFFAWLAQSCDDPELRRAATDLQAEEKEHIALLQSWLRRVPEPAPDWDQDPDPPRYTD
ncbi:ferritin family protein [Ramlibacter tataouinensis]|uniref:ferritin-like domain-containing protein n=1 Tax=Ramlibacter tataouinensis TaxID=94132 RepID=UPI0022F3892C|nr:ferritin family protein [Ramlibacter tataouinensis]WBY03203.1 ferritin family protein [Ramlibacter tataouinensis]